MVANRVNILWGILGVVGGMAIGAWYMGSKIRSPAEMAARTAEAQRSLWALVGAQRLEQPFRQRPQHFVGLEVAGRSGQAGV